MEVRLIVLNGAMKGREIPLPTGEVTIGRRKGCKIRLGDARVSRQHCRVMFDGRRAVVEDLDSANGTLVNNQRVRKAPLKPGDIVQVGAVQFRVAAAGGEVSDDAVAVMGQPPGHGSASPAESVAGAMAAMAEAETVDESAALPIELDFSDAGEPAATPSDDQAVELVDEGAAGADAIEINWEPSGGEEEKEKDTQKTLPPRKSAGGKK